MRVFMAVDLPEDLKKEIASLTDDLQKSGADVKWIKPENFHFTLKFIGEMAREKLELLTAALENVGQREKKFSLSLKELGAFPSDSNIRVIWLGAEQGASDLKSLAEKVEEQAEKLGFPEEFREFQAHLTLGRARSRKNLDVLKKKMAEIKLSQLGPFPVDRFKIFQSVLKPTGPVYSVLKEIFLGDS